MAGRPGNINLPRAGSPLDLLVLRTGSPEDKKASGLAALGTLQLPCLNSDHRQK